MSAPHCGKLIRLIRTRRGIRGIFCSYAQQDPDALGFCTFRIVDSLVVVANAASNHVHMCSLELAENGILISDAGTHRVDYVDADNMSCARTGPSKSIRGVNVLRTENIR